MGRISAHIFLTNILDPSKAIEFDCLVDTGSALLVLPKAWRERLGELQDIRTVQVETAAQELVDASVCGPVKLQIEGFVPVYTEVLFLEMQPRTDSFGIERYEPLLGYIPLEQSQAAVDMLGHRLIKVPKVDLK